MSQFSLEPLLHCLLDVFCYQVQANRQQVHPPLPNSRTRSPRAQNPGNVFKTDDARCHGLNASQRIESERRNKFRIDGCPIP